MSRVEDDRQADRIAQQLLVKKQQEEAKARDQKQAESAFARKLQQGNAEKVAQQARQSATAAYETLVESEQLSQTIAEAKGQDGKEGTGRQVLRHATAAFQEKLAHARAGEGEKLGESRLAAAESDAFSALGRAEDQGGAERTGQGRSEDARTTREELGRGGKDDARAAAGRAGRDSGKTDADAGGGGKQGGGEKKDGGGSELGGGFRFNPALMAPVPVARPRDTGASERLRRIAQEIAQKIVERVRVGTNAAGLVEFQIDLRSDVLKGLQIKVSGGRGKISAVFSGSDREVLKLLDEHKDQLRQALSTRGLSLEELKIEAKA